MSTKEEKKDVGATAKSPEEQVQETTSEDFYKARMGMLVIMALTVFYKAYFSSAPSISFQCGLVGLGCAPWKKTQIIGNVAEIYGAVTGAYQRGYDSGDDMGSTFTAFSGPKMVVYLSRGFKSQKFFLNETFNSETIQPLLGASHAISNMVIAKFVDDGLLNLDEKVSTYWPEFSQGGKDNVLLKDLMSHRAGVGFLDEDHIPTPEIASDPVALSEKIASQPHNFGGEKILSQHTVTRDWYVYEVIRRVDPKKRTISKLVDDILNTPLKTSFYVGIPEYLHKRVAPIIPTSPVREYLGVHFPSYIVDDPASPIFLNMLTNKSSIAYKSTLGSLPKVNGEQPKWPHAFNQPELWGGASSFSAFGDARSLAICGAFMANVGTVGSVYFISPETHAKVMEIQDFQVDQVLETSPKDLAYTAGGWAVTKRFIEKGEKWYGTWGLGGMTSFFNVDHQSSFAYIPNTVRMASVNDRRALRTGLAFNDQWKNVEAEKIKILEEEAEKEKKKMAREERRALKVERVKVQNAQRDTKEL